jgi:DNA-binding NarL/FixJ family response regulator
MSAHEAAVRIILLEDHTTFRQALAFTLGREPDLAVVAQAGTLAEGRAALDIGIDIAVTDLDLPDGDGADFIRDLRQRHPRAQVLVLTASAGRRDLARAVAAGAAGVLHKSAPLMEVVAAVRRLCAGELLVARDELATLIREGRDLHARDGEVRASMARLTIRERQVLEHLAQGLGDKEIAARLGVGIETVKTHTANMFAKLGVESRMQALILAVRYGVVRLD